MLATMLSRFLWEPQWNRSESIAHRAYGYEDRDGLLGKRASFAPMTTVFSPLPLRDKAPSRAGDFPEGLARPRKRSSKVSTRLRALSGKVVARGSFDGQ